MGTRTIDDSMFEPIAAGNDPDAVISFLESLPPEREHSWELHLTRLVERAPSCRSILTDIIADTQRSEAVRFAAFFACCTYHRRQDNHSTFGALLREHTEFDAHPLYPHLQSLHESQRSTPESGRKAIEYAREAARRVGEHPGVRHSLALAIVERVEQPSVTEETGLLSEAEENVTIALDQIEYPRYYDTYGRILTLRGEFESAREKIRTAIDLEDPEKDDYAMRIGMYREHEYRTVLEEHSAEIASEQRSILEKQQQLDEEIATALDRIEETRERSEQRMREIQTQTLQFMAFFATMLAVIVSSITITTRFPLPDGAALILVLTGGLLAAFGGFSIVLPIAHVKRKAAALFGMGTLLAGAGLGVIAVL